MVKHTGTESQNRSYPNLGSLLSIKKCHDFVDVFYFRVHILQLDITNDKEIEAATGVVREKVGEEGKSWSLK